MRSLVNLAVALCVSLHAVFGCCLHHGHSADSRVCGVDAHVDSHVDSHVDFHGRSVDSNGCGVEPHCRSEHADRAVSLVDIGPPIHVKLPDCSPSACSQTDCGLADCALSTQLRPDDSESSKVEPDDDVPAARFGGPTSIVDRPLSMRDVIDRPPAALRRHLLCQVLLI